MANEKKPPPPPSYEDVVAILDAAQGIQDGTPLPDYQGYGAFWQDLELFEEVVLYGQRMIAPAAGGGAGGGGGGGGHCCGGSAAGGGELSAAEVVDPSPPDAPVDADCWPSSGQGGGRPLPGGDRRSDRSGIVRGLRGQYPFDGSIFPPLLWEAAAVVSADDVARIAAWIDAGCPTAEEIRETGAARAAVEVVADERLALARGEKRHEVSKKHCNHDSRKVQGLRQRKEISCLSPEELGCLREALACMFQYGAYWLDDRSFDFWARIHTNSCQHGWEEFLPWHRLYLYFFEQQLQDYDPHITLPYWSWPDYADVNRTTYQTNVPDLGVIPEAFRCWIDEPGVEKLKRTGLFSDEEIAGLEKLVGNKEVGNSGRRFLEAAGLEYALQRQDASSPIRWQPKVRAVYNVLLNVNPLWFPNRWPGEAGRPTRYPTPPAVQAILSVADWPGFGGGPQADHHFGALEEVHNGMHNFAGGVNPAYGSTKDGRTVVPGVLNLATGEVETVTDPDVHAEENPQFGYMTDNRVTAYDPMFWAHHGNVDRLWAVWQERHPGVDPVDLEGAMPPWSLTVRDTLSTRKLGYEYLKDTYHYPVHSDVGIRCFNAEKAGVMPGVLDSHRRAEVRLHRVQRGNLPNCFIRVFLNSPDADAGTATDGNDRFVGEVATFHGSCYGGPRHCEVPLPRERRFDRRKLHHNEPRNFRLDATDAVQRVLAGGADDLSVHLVAVGLDGRPTDDALFLDGVSLTFMD